MRTSETSDFESEQFLWNLFLDLYIAQRYNYHLCLEFVDKFGKKEMFSNTVNKINTEDFLDIPEFEDELNSYENKENSCEEIINYCLKLKHSFHYNNSTIKCIEMDFSDKNFSEKEIEKIKKANIISFKQDQKVKQIQEIDAKIKNEKCFFKQKSDFMVDNQSIILESIIESLEKLKTLHEIELTQLTQTHEMYLDEISFTFDKNLFHQSQ